MRAEAEQAYPNGGQVVGPPEPDISEEIVERTTHPGVGQSLTGIILQGRQDAIDRLKIGQQRIEERRVKQQKRAQQDKWFALAQGMLAPTRTGGFGESLGTTAGLMQQQSAMAAEQEMALEEQEMAGQMRQDEIEAQMIDQLLEQEAVAARRASTAAGAEGAHGRIQTMLHPEDRNKPMAKQRLVFGVSMTRPGGKVHMQALRDEHGAYQIAADRLEPARAAAIIELSERAKQAEQRSQGQIAEAYGYRSPLDDVRRSNEIFENAEVDIKTSGVQALKNRLANALGFDFGDTVELTELQMRSAEHYLSRLEKLKGGTSDKDVREMKGISVGLGTNATANYRMLKKMEAIYVRGIKEGIREGYQTGDMDAVADLWKDHSGHVYYPGLPFVKDKAEYDALPAGSHFYEVGRWGSARLWKPEEE